MPTTDEELHFITLVTRTGGGLRDLKRKLMMTLMDEPWVVKLANLLLHPDQDSFEEQLKQRNFLHFARWVVVPELPRRSDGQPSEDDWTRDLLFFITNYNQDAAKYVQGFIDTYGEPSLGSIWGATPGWPGELATRDRVLQFAVAHMVTHAHEFKAYPHLTTNDVRNSFRVDRSLRNLLADLDDLDEQARLNRWRGFLVDVQHSLGRQRTRPEQDQAAMLAARCNEVVGLGDEHLGLVALVPLPREHIVAVTAAIAGLPTNHVDSPFASVPGTHVARMAVLDAVRHEDQKVSRPLKSAYVLLAADAQGSCGQFVRHMFSALEQMSEGLAERIFGETYGLPNAPFGVEALVEQIEACRCPAPELEFIDYPGQSVWDVLRSEHTHKQLETLLRSRTRVEGIDGPERRGREDSQIIEGLSSIDLLDRDWVGGA